MDLFSYVKILGKPIKKQVNINHCKYVCMKLLLGKLTICIDTQSRSPCTNAQCLHYNWHQYIANTEGVFIAPWHPAHKEQGGKEQGAREQRIYFHMWKYWENLYIHRDELSSYASSHLFSVITSLIDMWKCGYKIWKRKFLHLLPTEQIDSQKGTSNALWHPHFALLPFSPKDQGAKEQRRLPLHWLSLVIR